MLSTADSDDADIRAQHPNGQRAAPNHQSPAATAGAPKANSTATAATAALAATNAAAQRTFPSQKGSSVSSSRLQLKVGWSQFVSFLGLNSR